MAGPSGSGPSGDFTSSGEGALKGASFSVNFLIQMLNSATVSAKNKLAIMQARRSSVSIADMFDMQMLMNHLSQLSEMTTSIVSAANSSIQSMARNLKS